MSAHAGAVAEKRHRFGRTLAHVRTQEGYSQASFAVMLGVTQGAVSQWETGRTAPAPEIVFAIERTLGPEGGSLSQFLGYLPSVV